MRRGLRLDAARRCRRAAEGGRRRPDRAARARAARRRPQRRRRLRGSPRDALGARARRRPRAREQGEPRRRRRARPRRARAGSRADPAGRQRALGALPVPRGTRAGAGRHARAHRLGRPVPRPHARRARGRHARAGARTSDLAHGAEDHGGLRNAREQRARGDRGALSVRRAIRPHRGRDPADVDRALARPLPRRRRARASRLSGHARADLVRAHVPRARCDAAAAARPHGADTRVLAARHGDVPDARARARRGGARAAARRASTTPRTRSRWPRSSPDACRSSGSRRSWGRRSRPQATDPVRDVDDLVEADRAAREIAEGALATA